MMQKLNRWHKTKTGLVVFAVVEFLLADGFFSLAIDRGNPFYYLLALIFFVGTLQNIIRLIGTVFHGRRKPSKTR